MTSALMYCSNEYKKAHDQMRRNKEIFNAFERLAIEINKLDYIDQLNLYSVTTQFLESLVNKEPDTINPLEVFVLRTNSIVINKHGVMNSIGLALGVIAISLSVIVLAVSVGFGIGFLLSLWQTPLIFMASLLAAEAGAVIIAATSSAIGIGAGVLSGILFFKKPRIQDALDNCVEEIKKSYLSATSETPDSANDTNLESEGCISDKKSEEGERSRSMSIPG